MIDKLLNLLEKYNIKRAAELIKNEINNPHEELIYDVETLIFPDYRHLKTPLLVAEFLRDLEKISLQSDYLPKGDLEFCLNSMTYSKRQEIQANFIPITTNWPSFRIFNEAQRKWYFYWRKEVLNYNYIDTDTNYIMVFVYELINYTFNDKAAFNISMLERLYTNYHDKHSALSYLLPQWISDFYYELGEFDLEKKWAPREPNYENADYEYLKHQENKLEAVSITFWKRFFSYQKTKFFEVNRNLIYKIFKKSISLLETHYQVQGKSLVNEWMPKHKQFGFQRPLFLYALIARKTQRKLEGGRRPTFKMREDLRALFRLAENVARISTGEKRQLSVDESLFPKDFKNNLIELFTHKSKSSLFPEGRFVKTREKGVRRVGSAIPEPPEIIEPGSARSPVIKFDLDRINILDKESKELLEIFALRYDEVEVVEEEEERKSNVKAKAKANANAEANAEKVKEKKSESQPPDKPDLSVAMYSRGASMMTDLANETLDKDAGSFLAKLTELEREFLRGFTNWVRATQEGIQTLKTHGIMMGVFVSKLNEKSLEYLGDNLIEQEGDILKLNEDFEQVLLRLAKEDY